MPYALKGNCVIKSDTGAEVKCHKNHKEAVAHLKALYANVPDAEKKELDEATQALLAENPEENETKENAEKCYGMGYMPAYGATSFEELDALKAAQETTEAISELTSQMFVLAGNIINNTGPDADRVGQLQDLVLEYADRLGTYTSSMEDGDPEDETKECAPSDTMGDEKKAGKKRKRNRKKESTFMSRIVDKVKEAVGVHEIEETVNRFNVFKGKDGVYRWVASYSNKFRDRDDPPEIIAEKSHLRFADKVDKEEYPLPELWLWHIKEWKCGMADMVTYDDNGFAVAAGHFDKGKEYIAEALAKAKEVAVSHGMPPESIRRDPSDPTVIVEHQTVEISPLPAWAAANQLTSFSVLKEKGMIPEHKRKGILGFLGVTDEQLQALEASNAAAAEKALANGIEFKEAPVTEVAAAAPVVEPAKVEDEKPEATPVAETEETPVVNTAEAKEKSDSSPDMGSAILKDLATAVQNLTSVIDKVNQKVDSVAAEVKEMKENKEKAAKEAEAATLEATPLASLTAMLAQSVIGRKETHLKETSKLADLHPKETEPVEVKEVLGIPFLDKMLSK